VIVAGEGHPDHVHVIRAKIENQPEEGGLKSNTARTRSTTIGSSRSRQNRFHISPRRRAR
jgi:hypothetical protein